MGTVWVNYTCPLCKRTGRLHDPKDDTRCHRCRYTGICDCGYDLRGLPIINGMVVCPECGQLKVPSPQPLTLAEQK